MKKYFVKVIVCAIFVAFVSTVNAHDANIGRTNMGIDLAGEWRVKLPEGAKDGLITLPGTTDMAGYGYPLHIDSLTRDQQFRRLTRKNSFIGKATYCRIL